MILDSTILTFVISIGCIGGVAGLIGVFVLLRNESLLGDTLSHATLPGVALTLLITQTKQLPFLLAGGTLSAACGAFILHIINHKTHLKKETAMGIVLSVFFGIGLLVLTLLQKKPIAHQAFLTTLFLGKAFLFLPQDSYFIVSLCMLVILFTLLFWKEYKLSCFDKDFASTIGYSPSAWSFCLLCSMIIIISLALQTMGVILTSSLLIAPAAAARQWYTRIEQISILAVVIGMTTSMIGVLVSNYVSHLPPGPVIVILLSCCVSISLIFSQRRIQSDELDSY